MVALLAEGVDRNNQVPNLEITRSRVALLAEGVDRNKVPWYLCFSASRSPSSRRAWIEIACWSIVWSSLSVALLAEGVDRNMQLRGVVGEFDGRPPRGGRG